MEIVSRSEGVAVSVVIAAFNRAEFIPQTIDSLLGQSFKDFELIVVDDGSTDQTFDLLRSYGHRLRFFRQKNRGPSAARNLGVSHARGGWIAFQDSDDVSAPDHLQSLFDFIQTRLDHGLVFANGGYLAGPQHDRATIIPAAK